MPKTYKLKVVNSSVRPNSFSIRDKKGDDPRQVVNNIVSDNNLKNGDIIEIDIVSIQDGQNHES